MANQISHLPHVKNVAAGRNKWDPVHPSLFELFFTLPPAIQGEFSNEDVQTLTQQVTKVSGLDALNKTAAAGSQKFYGVDVSFLKPVLDNTYAEITVELNLNLRNTTDNYVLKIFKAWGRLGYNLLDGTRAVKSQYCSDSMRIAQANRDGSIWRAFKFYDTMITSITGLETLDYTSSDAQKLTVKFRSDYWDEDLA
jgi:hypothetical protein